MLALHVQIQVKPDALDAFKAATLANAAATRQEPGVVRFEVGQQTDDPTKFMLYEVYRSPAAHAAHRETPHYAAWRTAVEGLMAVPRVGTRYSVVE